MIEKVQIKDATLFCGDWREIEFRLGQVDVIITDPPYGEVTHKGARSQKDIDGQFIDFKSITPEEFLAFSTEAVRLARRWVVITCEWRHAANLEGSGLPLVRLGVWVKPNGAPQFTGDRPGTGWEAVAILHREGKKRWNGGGHHAVWQCNVERGEHPTQKPIKLLSEWVQLFSDAGETILDPYMGSGTTGIAALRQGRRFIGVEAEPRYFDIACKRIAEAYDQPDLFITPPPREEASTPDLFTAA